MSTGITRPLAVLTALALATGGAVTLAGGASALPAGGELIYGLTTDNRLVTFRADAPGTVIDNQTIDLPPLATGTDIVGIDVRPRTGEIYALGADDQLYVLDPATGAATARGAAITPAITGDVLGFDFNPAADRLRIVTDTDQNLRVNPDTGGASLGTGTGGLDGTVRYRDTDQNAGQNPAVAAVAYDDNVDGTPAAGLVQYDIDVEGNRLVRQDSNAGILDTVGPLNANDVQDAGLDISGGTGTAYAVVRRPATPTGNQFLFGRINLTSGAFTPSGTGVVGPAATPLQVEDITAATSRFVVQAASVTEGDNVTVTVRRFGDVAEAQSVRVTLSDASADANDDVASQSTVLTFGPEQTTRSFVVSTLEDDFVEGTEVLAVTLSEATAGAAAGNASAATLSNGLTATSDPRVGFVVINDDETGAGLALTQDNDLVPFDVKAPGTATGLPVPVRGLGDGVDLVAIDTRPRNGDLYGLGSNNQLFVINRTTGVATAVGTPISPALVGTAVGFDFNPTVDLIRIVTDRDQNLRVSPVTGGASRTTAPTADADNPLNYAAGDRSAGTNPAVAAAGYTNSFNNEAGTATPTVTTLFDIDTATDSLVRQDPPNAGTLNSVGTGLGFTIADDVAVGLDIASAGNAAFANFRTGATPGNPNLYRVNTETGRAFALGALPTAAGTVEDIALTARNQATFTPPGATQSPSPTASPSATATATATPTPTVTGTTNPNLQPLVLRVERDTITPGVQGVVRITGTANRDIEVLAYSRPSTEYDVVRRVSLGQDGTAVIRILPGTNTRLYARYTGVADSDSRSVVQNVATALSLTVVRNGSLDYTFQGRILPRRAGQLITLYRVTNGREVITSQIRTDNSGTYRIRRVFTGQGTFGFLTRTGQNLTNVAGVSNGGRARPTSIYAGPQR